MKNVLIILFALFAVVACQKPEPTIEQIIATGDLKAIRAKKDALSKQESKLRKELGMLDQEIAKLDPQVKTYDLVTAVTPVDTLFKHYVEVQGSVMTKDDSPIYPEMNGVMTRLYVREGQYVKRGALIATVDDGGLTQQIAQQKVQLELAKTTYERQKRLWEQNIGSEMQYLQAKNNYEAFQKGIAAMEQQLRKVNVYAPFAGTVEQILTKQGQVVSPGATPIIRLVGLGSMYVQAEVPENYLPTVRRGTKTIVNLDAIDTEYNSSVRRINSTINPASRSFTVEVGVPKNQLIKPNLIANLKINDYTNPKAILIPSSTINEDAQGHQFVFVVEEMINDTVGKVKRVIVETGESDEYDWVEITSEFDGSKQVIAEGAKTLSDGDEVQILPYESNRVKQIQD